jgi:hypothetical protein
MVVGHVGYGLCQGLGKWGGGEREREREEKNEGKNFFFPCYASKEEEAYCRSKRHRFVLLSSFLKK